MTLRWLGLLASSLAGCADPAGGALVPLDPAPASPAVASPASTQAVAAGAADAAAADVRAPEVGVPGGPAIVRLAMGVEFGIDTSVLLPGQSVISMPGLGDTTGPYGFYPVLFEVDKAGSKQVEIRAEEDVPEASVAFLEKRLREHGVTELRIVRTPLTVVRPPAPYTGPAPDGAITTLPKSALKPPLKASQPK